MLIVSNHHLLSDAKAGEDAGEHLGVGDCASDGGEMMDALAKVLADEIAGGAEGKGVLYATDGGEGVGEGFEVAGVGDDDSVRRKGGEVGSLREKRL